MTAQIQAQTIRKLRNRWLAQLSEWAAPALKQYGRRLCPAPPTPPASWKHGLLIGANHIGDVLYRTASLPALQRGLPGCDWHFLTAAPADEVLGHNPHLAGQIVLPPGPPDLPMLKEKIRAQLGTWPDVAVCYDSSTYWPSLLLAARLGIPNRVAYVHKGFSGLVTHPISFRYPQPFAAYFRELTAELTGQRPDWPLRPLVYPTTEDESAARQWWTHQGLQPGEPVIACFCTSRQPTGVWPLEKFSETFQQLRQKTSARMILGGAKQDRGILERMNREAKLNAPILAGELGLRAVYCLLRDCRVVIATDSGPRHLANAAGTPVVFVRNLSSSKIETGAYVETDHDLAPDVEFVRSAEQAHWMAQVAPADLVEKVLQLLEKKNGK